jgi:hypothetical protein
MQPHDHACYYCHLLVDAACVCPHPARAVLCDSCRIIYEPHAEGEEADSGR